LKKYHEEQSLLSKRAPEGAAGGSEAANTKKAAKLTARTGDSRTSGAAPDRYK
jgi:hypothetical protein